MQSIPIAIRLGGHPSTEGTLDAIARPPGERASRAVGTLLLFLAIGAAVFFIPPHIPWVLAAVGAGVFFSLRQWRGEYRVQRFSGNCPRCGHALEIAPGDGIRLPMKLTCFNCHHEPTLSLSA